MQVIIWRALELDNKKGRTLTVGMGAKPLIGIIKTITLRWAVNKTEIRVIKALAAVASEVYDDRNNLAHGVWMYPENGNPNDIYLHYMKTPRAYRILPKAEKLHPRDIKSTATKIKRLNERAERLINRIEKRQKREKAKQNAWPDKLPQ
ncbi:MAG: hypothetical protein O7C66_03790 [Alphaproteobacteria bacterium]|nr:hypothetical protein [Alphaproteobacteria bacterium]